MTAPNLLDELEPCPFCGREPAVRIPTDKDGFAVHVSCRCGAQLYGRNRHFAGEQEAIAAWNRRTHATLADMAKRLEAAERDARRYRFLRDIDRDGWPAVQVPCPCPDNIKRCRTNHTAPRRGDALDDAIDATQEGEG